MVKRADAKPITTYSTAPYSASHSATTGLHCTLYRWSGPSGIQYSRSGLHEEIVETSEIRVVVKLDLDPPGRASAGFNDAYLRSELPP